MDNIYIMVATHKDYEFPRSPGYVPIHVGRAISNNNFDFSGDDTGENISNLNRSFCELTGIYWMWKNVQADFYGISHYRRYFKPIAQGYDIVNGVNIALASDLMSIFNNYDIILPCKRNYWIETVRKHYKNAHNAEDLKSLEKVIFQKSPEYMADYERVMSRTKLSLYNMFVMPAEKFYSYCDWLFGILFDLMNKIPWESYGPYQARVFGFLGERLLNVWVEHNIKEERVCYIPVVNIEGEDILLKVKGLIKRKITGVKMD